MRWRGKMGTEATNDGLRPIDFSELLLFVVNRMVDESDRLKLTRSVTEEGMELSLTIEDDHDGN
jgi:hypothetical protein